MFNGVKIFIIHLKDFNFRILSLELLLFSVIIGASLHSIPLFCLMLLGLSWGLSRPKGLYYMIYVLSFGWGLVAMGIGYFLVGWGWGIACGIFTLICALGVHFRDLKQPLYNPIVPEENIQLEQNWPWHRQNLN